ncbi:MAG: alpha-E domain-containing protein [Propionibacteriaceae bacterium]|jgi:uncharacterized alpha-E superfamily protein|nr:alpha-E domain-containing protein [Propionibacteriaceae bacterium]
MLSRVAESLFWIGRYLERADGTARLLDIHFQLILEDPRIDEAEDCRTLLYILGTPATSEAELTTDSILERLAVDPGNPPSIVACLQAARENGRRAREIISTELWECLNTIVQSLPSEVHADRIHAFFQQVRQQVAMALGIADTTMSRDEAYQFFILGVSLERADMTARLLATRALSGAQSPSWITLLRSAGAYHACLRAYRGLPLAHDAAEFLLLDRLFPRSVMASVNRAMDAVTALDPPTGRSNVTGASRILGQIMSALGYLSIAELMTDLPQRMDRIQIAINDASAAIRERYFPTELVPTWVGEQT